MIRERVLVKKRKVNKALKFMASTTFRIKGQNWKQSKEAKTKIGRALKRFFKENPEALSSMKKKCAKATANTWRNPKIRAKRIAGMKDMWTPQRRRRHAAILRESWKRRAA